MSANPDFGFGKFVPGFDFLQNLAKGASPAMAQMPGLSSWVAPTLDVEELDKRIAELKAVQFWLEQNGRALAATVQALEVQKMTLSTLQGMNFQMADLAEALKAKPEQATDAAPAQDGGKAGGRRKSTARSGAAGDGSQPAGGAAVDPLQWWSALTQQFQEIAAHAMQDVAQHTATAGAPAGAATAAPAPRAGKRAKAGPGTTRAGADRARTGSGRTRAAGKGAGRKAAGG